MRELDKSANQRCKHQRHTGCQIYERRPHSCRLWSCAWLVEEAAANLRRPDFTHYVIDIMPDYVTAVQEGGERVDIPVVQVWVDPKYPDAHRDPALRAYLARRGEEDGAAAIIRYGASEGFVLIPPAVSGRDEWIEHRNGISDREHTAVEKHRVVGDLMARAVGL